VHKTLSISRCLNHW